jgi:carbon monoxide dehydrogenase subunit G
MQLTDTRDIKAPPETVWAAILDPEVLKACVPGCEAMSGSPETGFEATVTQKVGPVSARFTGTVTLSEMDPPRAVVISGEGKGGAAGFAKGGARVTLDPTPEGTRLTYEVEAKVGGKIAQLGSRLIDSFAKKMADEFFTRFQAAVEGPAEPEAAEAGGEEAVAESGQAKKGWFKRLIGS